MDIDKSVCIMLKFDMQNYSLDELYIVSIIKKIKDFKKLGADYENYIQYVGFAIVTKSRIIPTMFVDIYTKNFYEPFRKNIEIGKICYFRIHTMASLFKKGEEQKLANARKRQWNCINLVKALRHINRDYPDFLHELLDEELDEDKEIDISKMN